LAKTGAGTWVLKWTRYEYCNRLYDGYWWNVGPVEDRGDGRVWPVEYRGWDHPSVVVLSGTGGNQIADSSVVTFTDSGLGGAILRMNNMNETVAGLSSFGGGIVENEAGVAGTATITVTVPAGGFQSFDGKLRDGDGVGTDGTLALTKAGAGNLTLSGASTHTGANYR
jgi:hypothetical protein